jgi:hypothetical protein
MIDLGVRADDTVITLFQSLRGAKIFEYDDQVSLELQQSANAVDIDHAGTEELTC